MQQSYFSLRAWRQYEAVTSSLLAMNEKPATVAVLMLQTIVGAANPTDLTYDFLLYRMSDRLPSLGNRSGILVGELLDALDLLVEINVLQYREYDGGYSGVFVSLNPAIVPWYKPTTNDHKFLRFDFSKGRAVALPYKQ